MSMNDRPCYRRNLAAPLSTNHRLGCARTIPSSAIPATILCALACTFLVGCGKSTAQYIDRGNRLFASGQYGDATLNYRNAIKKSPTSGEAYYRLGLGLVKQNQIGEAYQAFNHAVQLSPRNIPAKIQFGDLSLAIYARDPKHPAALYTQAQSMADALLAPGGNRVEGLRLKGALALVDNHPGNAVEALREARQLAPDNAEVAGGMAQALLRDNQPDEAEKIARQTVERHPQYNPGYEVLYAIYGSQQNWEKAETLLKLWIANNPKEANPVLRLAAFYYARQQPDEGEKTLNSLLDHRDRFPQADLLAGDFHAVLRNQEKALTDYQRGATRDQSRQQVYQERVASTLAALGRNGEAIKAADVILAKDPKNQFVRGLKVELLDRVGGAQNLNAAVNLANDLAKEAPSNGRMQLLVGQALLMKGSLDEALTHLQRAAQAEALSEAAQLSMARLELLRRNYAAVL